MNALFLTLTLACNRNSDMETFEHNGVNREYTLHVPASYDGSTSVPLMFNFHGFGGTASDQMAWADMRELANENNFINIRIEKNVMNATIIVEDNGPGFSKGSLKKVFDRFYTDRPKNENNGNHSGLGLSISKQIVEAHGGSIEALNRLNQKNECLGGSVKVTFPEIKT